MKTVIVGEKDGKRELETYLIVKLDGKTVLWEYKERIIKKGDVIFNLDMSYI